MNPNLIRSNSYEYLHIILYLDIAFQYFKPVEYFTMQAVYPEDMYKAMVGGSTSLNPTEDVKPGWGVMTEAILTFIIVLTFLHSKVDKKSQHAPLSVGLSVAACSFAG